MIDTAITEQVESCFEQAESQLGRTFARPQVRCDLRGRAAGQARSDGVLRFNLHFYRQDPARFLREVVPHEVAHWLVWQLHGHKVRPHGHQWQALMRQLFALPPKRTHDFSLRETTYLYRCRCQTHQLSVRRHNKVQRGTGQYCCRHCGATLAFADNA